MPLTIVKQWIFCLLFLAAAWLSIYSDFTWHKEKRTQKEYLSQYYVNWERISVFSRSVLCEDIRTHMVQCVCETMSFVSVVNRTISEPLQLWQKSVKKASPSFCVSYICFKEIWHQRQTSQKRYEADLWTLCGWGQERQSPSSKSSSATQTHRCLPVGLSKMSDLTFPSYPDGLPV